MKNWLVVLLGLTLAPVCAADDAQLACQKAFESRDFEAASKTASRQSSFDGLMCAGRAQFARRDFSSAQSTFAQAITKTDSKFNAMVATTFLARATHAGGNDGDALKHYAQSLSIAKEIDSWQGQWSSFNEIGQIWRDRREFKTALENFRAGYPKASNDNERSESNQLMAETYHQMGDHDHAIEFQLKSTVLDERSGGVNALLESKLKLAIFAMSGNDLPIAGKQLAEISKLAQEFDSLYWQARAKVYSSRLEKLNGNAEQSVSELAAAIDLANKSGSAAILEAITNESQE